MDAKDREIFVTNLLQRVADIDGSDTWLISPGTAYMKWHKSNASVLTEINYLHDRKIINRVHIKQMGRGYISAIIYYKTMSI